MPKELDSPKDADGGRQFETDRAGQQQRDNCVALVTRSQDDMVSGAARQAPDARRKALVEALVVFFSATLVCSVLWQLRGVSGFINRHLQDAISSIFLFLPTILLIKKGEELGEYGLKFSPVGKGLLTYLVFAAVVFPAFAVGFYVFYQYTCTVALRGGYLPGWLARRCGFWISDFRRVKLAVPKNFIDYVLGQFLAIALPEEYFFRGYLQTRLEHAWPSRRRFLGAAVGPSLLVASVLFALGHFLVDFHIERIAVFFPGLVFGWMRQYTGSIFTGVLFHASCNLVSILLHSLFFSGP